MAHAQRSSFAVALLIAAVAVGPLPVDSGLTVEQQAFVDEGLDHFAAAGLAVTSVRFVFHPETSGCRFRRGLYDPATDTVEICTMHLETLVHELAHAWVDSNLTEGDKTEFLEHRGLDSWRDHSRPWAERGTEHAATVIAWGVGAGPELIMWVDAGGTPQRRLLMIPDSTAPELAEAYLMLTGHSAHSDLLAPAPLPAEDFSPEARRIDG